MNPKTLKLAALLTPAERNGVRDRTISRAEMTKLVNARSSTLYSEYSRDMRRLLSFIREGAAEDAPAGEREGLTTEEKGNEKVVEYRGDKPVKTLDELLELAEVDRTVWEVDRWTSNVWGVTSAAGYSNNWQVKAFLKRKVAIITEFEPVKPVSVNIVPTRPTLRKAGVKTALVLMDRQYGFRRDEVTGYLDPTHDRRAIDIVVQVAELVKPDWIIDPGDVLDLPEFAPKYPRTPDFSATTQASICEAAYDNGRLRKAVPDAPYDTLEGNHDKRLQKFIIENAKAAYGLKSADDVKQERDGSLTIPRLLDFDKLGINYISGYPDGEVWVNEGLRVIHGDVAKNKSGATVTSLLDDITESVIQGHIHRMEMAARTRYRKGKPYTVWAASGGCLCRVDGAVPGVKSRQNWNQGFFLVRYDPDGWWHHIEPYPIENGMCYFNGQWIEGRVDVERLSEETGFNFRRAA
jgi:hypothetical protein